MEKTLLTILLIDDNSGNAYLVNEYLKSSTLFQCELHHALDLEKGKELLNEMEFDAILLDLNLKTSKGLDTLNQFNQWQNYTPTIVLTEHDDRYVNIEAVKQGAQDFLVKDELNTYTLEKSIYFSLERFNYLLEVENYSRALEKSEKKLLAAQNLAHIGSWELDVKTRKMDWSDEIFNIFELDKGSIKTDLQTFINFIHGEDFDLLNEVFNQAIETGQEFNVDHKISLSNKKVKYLNTHISSNRDSNADRMILIGTVQDITARKEIEKALLKSEEKYYKLFHESMDGIYITTFEGYFIDFNSAIEKILGYDKEELGAMNVSKLYADPVEREAFKNEISKSGFVKDYEIKLRKKDGEVIDCVLTSHIWKSTDGKTIGYQGIIRDVTRRKKTEELIKAKEIAERSAQIKQQFLANMSHEIRTPLNAISGMSNLLLEGHLTDQQKKYVKSITTSSNHLVSLINEILDFSKIESGKIEFHIVEFTLPKLVQEVIDTFQFKTDEKAIVLKSSIDAAVPDNVLGDPTKLKQILINLLGNAVKFTDRGEICITVKLLDVTEDAAHLSFAVADTGIGISPEHLHKIFDSFTQAGAGLIDKRAGTGLGLTITKQLIELQNGHIEVESQLNAGSKFTFDIHYELPDSDAKVGLNENLMIQSIEIDNKSILIAEDNRVNQLVIRETLYNWFRGIHLEVVNNGLEALDMLSRQSYDLIIMDVQMPEMDGLEATRRIRLMNPPISQTPILALTAFATEGEEQRCMDAGMNDYLTKPWSPVKLNDKITRLLNLERVIPMKQADDTPQEEQSGSGIQIDLTYLNSVTKSDRTLQEKIVNLLLEETPLELDKLDKACASRDWEMVRSVAHKMKSSVHLLGIGKLTEIVKQTENNARNREELDSIPSLVQSIKEITRIGLQQIEDFFLSINQETNL